YATRRGDRSHRRHPAQRPGHARVGRARRRHGDAPPGEDRRHGRRQHRDRLGAPGGRARGDRRRGSHPRGREGGGGRSRRGARGRRASQGRARARETRIPQGRQGKAGRGKQGRRSPGHAVNPSRIFILRPVATALLMVAVLLSGIVAYRELPLSALPEVDYPTIQVVTLYPGASPDVVTSSITAPLERQFGQMPGLKQMSSTSSGGASVVTLQFELAIDLDTAEQEVQAGINAGSNLLPSDLPSPPIYSKVNPADAPIMTLGITSRTIPMTDVQNVVDTRLAQKVSQIPGVGLVTLSGGQRPAVRVQV